jgi:pyrroloquinoline quinone biosynthesis protein D
MTLADTAVPSLPRGVRLHWDRVREAWVLLAPERVLKLDPVGRAVLAKVDGTASFGAIVTALAADYAAPRERIAEDAARFLAGLAERRMVDLR